MLLNLFPQDSPAETLATCHKQVHDDPVTNYVCAQGTWPMSITLPAQHRSGTYWYHTYKHGAVALQLASGLAGALIVTDPNQGLERLPAVQAAIKNGEEKVMVIQNIQFQTGVTGTAPVDCATVYGSACRYPVSAANASTTANGQLSINGQFNPTVTMQVGEAPLWRVINTTPSTVLPMCLSQLPTGSATSAKGKGKTPQPAVTQTTAPLLYVLAADGVPVQIPNGASNNTGGAVTSPFVLGAPQPDVVGNATGLANNEFLFLAPGQRLDLMVQAPSSAGNMARSCNSPAARSILPAPSSCIAITLGISETEH